MQSFSCSRPLPRAPLLAALPVGGTALLVHDYDDLDLVELGFVVVDQTVREPSQGLAPQTTANDRRRLWKGLDLLDSAADSREERNAKTGAACFIVPCGVQKLGLRQGVEGVACHEISAAARRRTSSPGSVSTCPLWISSSRRSASASQSRSFSASEIPSRLRRSFSARAARSSSFSSRASWATSSSLRGIGFSSCPLYRVPRILDEVESRNTLVTVPDPSPGLGRRRTDELLQLLLEAALLVRPRQRGDQSGCRREGRAVDSGARLQAQGHRQVRLADPR